MSSNRPAFRSIDTEPDDIPSAKRPKFSEPADPNAPHSTYLAFDQPPSGRYLLETAGIGPFKAHWRLLSTLRNFHFEISLTPSVSLLRFLLVVYRREP